MQTEYTEWASKNVKGNGEDFYLTIQRLNELGYVEVRELYNTLICMRENIIKPNNT